MDRFVVRNGSVELAASVAGDGPRALFVPGMSITAAGLGELVDALREFLSLTTFDLRGHGESGAAGPGEGYGYDDFAADTAAVGDAVWRDGPAILLGFSLGGDLALDQAAVRPDTPALFLIDGGTPLSEPFLDEAELDQMRELIESEPPADYALSGDEHVAALRQIDAHRRTATERFDALTCPVTMVMSTTIAGEDGVRAGQLNDQWRGGVDDLVSTWPESRPAIELHRLPGGHDLPLTSPLDVADIVRERVGRLGEANLD